MVNHHDCTGLRNLNFKCITCNCEFDGEEQYQIHVKTHDTLPSEPLQTKEILEETNVVHKCKECSSNNDDLNSHVDNKHVKETGILKEPQPETFQCDKCEYETGQNEQLAIHATGQHTTTESTSCTKCDYDGNNKKELDAHLL